ncbi:MAG: O-antigen ligase family protein [Fidelibacterota bacterium]|nr:MAG: O-antigen ligase family protein [Candidatus Neomarinimicrobiota bacterium]
MLQRLRLIRAPLLLLGLQGGAVISTAIHPFMPFILSACLITTLIVLFYSQVLLVLLADVGLVKGALIEQFPIFETIDFTVLLSVLILFALAWKLTDPLVRKRVMRYRVIIAAFAVWAVWMIISSLYAPRLDWAFEKSLRFALFTTILFLGPLVLIQRREESRTLLNIFLGIGFLGAVFLVGQGWSALGSTSSLQSVVRLTILTANPIAAGRILSICAAMATILIITKMGRARYWGPLLILFLVTSLFTGSRGPVLSFIVAVSLLGLFLGGKARRRTVYYGVVIAAVIMLVFILSPEELTSRYRLYMEGELAATQQGLMVLNTVNYRIMLWSKALVLWTQDLPHLLLGTGTAGYIMAFPWRDMEYPHNLPLELLAEFGLIGLGVFSLHILLITKQIYHRCRLSLHREEMQWLIGSLTMFFATLVSGDLNDNRMLWFFLGGLLATMNINTTIHQPSSEHA